MRTPEPTSLGWGATLVLIALVLVAIALFWVWWSLPNRRRGKRDSDAEVDPTESKERLELLRSARQWGDVSTTYDTYLRRESKNGS